MDTAECLAQPASSLKRFKRPWNCTFINQLLMLEVIWNSSCRKLWTTEINSYSYSLAPPYTDALRLLLYEQTMITQKIWIYNKEGALDTTIAAIFGIHGPLSFRQVQHPFNKRHEYFSVRLNIPFINTQGYTFFSSVALLYGQILIMNCPRNFTSFGLLQNMKNRSVVNMS
jgi:hypothetical protein